MQTVKSSTEEELSNLSVAQLKSICVKVGIRPKNNRKLTAKALKEAEVEHEHSDASGESESEGEEGNLPMDSQSGDLMKEVLKELTSLKRKVDAIGTPPAGLGGNVEQLTELHDELMRERQAKKIYPDHNFEKERDQHDYDACKDVARLLSYVDASLLPYDQQEALGKALKRVEGRAATVIVGSLEGWGTASHIVSEEQSFLELRWKDAIAEARRKRKAEDKGKGQSFFRSGRRRTSASSQHKPPFSKSPSPANPAPSHRSKDLSTITCFKCLKQGHYANKCPAPRALSATQ